MTMEQNQDRAKQLCNSMKKELQGIIDAYAKSEYKMIPEIIVSNRKTDSGEITVYTVSVSSIIKSD